MKRPFLLSIFLLALASITHGQVNSQRVIFTGSATPTSCVAGKVYTTTGLSPAKAWVGTSAGTCTEIDPTAAAPVGATYITQTPNSSLTNEQALSLLATGIPLVTTTTGIISISSVTNDVQTKAAIVPNTTPTAGQILVGNAGGTAYAAVSVGSDATLASTGALTIAANAVTLAKLATQATNTVLGNATSGTAVPTALAVGTCSTASSALIWTTNTGFGCNTSITAAAVPVGGITGLGTGVGAALATNVGSAGAPVLFNGAGGTPSSMTGTNISGTAASLTAGAVSGFTAGVGTLTGPASSGVAETLGNNETITGIKTFSPAARSSGSAAYLTINTPADTGISTATESIGENHVTATRTWVDGTVALQRERFWAGPTYNKTTTSAVFTDVFNVYYTPPVAGTGVTFTRGHTLGIVDSTSAASSITGGFIVANTLGTTATSVGIGAGNVNAGGNGTFGGTLAATGHTTFEGVTSTGATGTGKLVYDGTPTLVTPVIGAATGTSLSLSGSAAVANAQQYGFGTGTSAVAGSSASTGTLDFYTANNLAMRIGTAGDRIITLNATGYNTCTALTTTAAVLGCTVSDERVKHDINPFADRGLAAIRKIRPITFQFNRGTAWYKGRTELGLSAQNLKAANPLLASSTENGSGALLQPEPLALHAVEIDAIKQLDARLTKLEKENAHLRRLLKRRH